MENYKTLMKEIKEDLSQRKDFPCSLIERCDIVKMTTFPQLTTILYDPSKPKPIQEFLRKFRGSSTAKAILGKNQGGRLTLPNFKT